jgi:hypothetical protein
MSEEKFNLEECLKEWPESELERHLIEEFLLSKGYRMADLHLLPKEEVVALMREACIHAALKLAEVEARARFRKEIEAPG